MTPYIPHHPTPRQTAFLLVPNREAFFGGAAGGGKSDALLMGALQYVDVPGYNALLLRRTFKQLDLQGALMSRAQEWLSGTDASWNAMKSKWTFPSGATLTFGFLERENDKYRYQGSEFQYIGFDELTQFTESQYKYLFSRLRKLANAEVPLRMRAASNPGNVGHTWTYNRFINPSTQGGRVFIPSKIADNPHLDQDEYIESLGELDGVERAQLLEGNWTIREGGSKFKRSWFPIIDEVLEAEQEVRYWDLAATEKSKDNRDPDWTVGLRLGRLKDGRFVVYDVKRVRTTAAEVERLMYETAERDGLAVKVRYEEEGGASGKAYTDHLKRNVMAGFDFEGVRPTGNKDVRAAPVSSQAQSGNILILHATWNSDLFDELELFGIKNVHDDQVDALSGALQCLTRKRKKLRLIA